jgi:hypothetical protein
VDRLPMVEWASYWDKTLERWRGEGLPADITDRQAVRDHLGLDPWRQFWVRAIGPNAPPPAYHGSGILCDADGYTRMLPNLYPRDAFDQAQLRAWAEQRRRGDLVVSVVLEGFFWFPRRLLGIERHLFAFHDQPDLIHRINSDLLAFQLRVLDETCAILTPDFAHIAEDMSYNHGPMLSRGCFDGFLTPYYRRLVPALKERNIRVFVDSDGDVTSLVPWVEAVGVEGMLPWERQAGCDVVQARRDRPRFLMIGAFDKMVMKRGEAAMRAEFERLLPVMRQGGFIPGVDHQTPPEVSLDMYRTYLALLREYCHAAAR